MKRDLIKKELKESNLVVCADNTNQPADKLIEDSMDIDCEDAELNHQIDIECLGVNEIRKIIENSECTCLQNGMRTKETIATMALLKLSKVGSDDASIIYENREKCCEKLLTDNKFTLLDLIKSDGALKAFTGINFTCFNNLVQCLELSEVMKMKAAVPERVLMTLSKLKLNLSFNCRSVLFQWSERACAKYYYDMILKLSTILKEAVYWPEKDETIANLPVCFEKFKNSRIVLDCTETPVEKPGCSNCRLRLYSHYKGASTVKFMIGISPGGQITLVSTGFGGRTSDKAIFDQSKVIEKLYPCVDAVLVDKGFSIEEECLKNNIKLQMPPKLGKDKQFSHEDFEKTKEIAAAKVHVERVIQRIKQFKVFAQKIEWTLVPYIDEIAIIICGLVNLSHPILSEDKFMYN